MASQDFSLELALRLLESAPAPRTTVQSPLRWSDDPDWKLDYCNVDRLSPQENRSPARRVRRRPSGRRSSCERRFARGCPTRISPRRDQRGRGELLHLLERARDVLGRRDAADDAAIGAVLAHDEGGALGEAVVDLLAAGVGHARLRIR
jgi:hypothetical protein